MTIEVRPWVMVWVARWISSSLYVSIEEVASSRMRMLGFET